MDSTHHDRFAGVAERFQVSEHPVRASSAQRRYVLNDCEKWSDLCDDAGELCPEPRSLPLEAGSLSCNADILAGEAPADEVSKSSWQAEFSDVSIAGHLGPVALEDLLAELVDLAERDRFESARPFQTKAEAPYAREQV
jgi:hypothetical protein